MLTPDLPDFKFLLLHWEWWTNWPIKNKNPNDSFKRMYKVILRYESVYIEKSFKGQPPCKLFFNYFKANISRKVRLWSCIIFISSKWNRSPVCNMTCSLHVDKCTKVDSNISLSKNSWHQTLCFNSIQLSIIVLNEVITWLTVTHLAILTIFW